MFDHLTVPDPEAVVNASDTQARRMIRDAHLSRRMLLLRQVLKRMPADVVTKVLAASREHPAQFRRAVAYPYVGVWASRAAQGLTEHSADMAFLAGLTAGPERRRFLSGKVYEPVCDDEDPYRDCFGVPATSRLSAKDFQRWESLLHQAWELLSTSAPEAAAMVADVIEVITPLPTGPTGDGRSVTARAAFGATGLSLPATPAILAATLVHEARHSLLNGVMDLLPLCHQSSRRFYSPWRLDPRPASGLLHGAFAFAGVVPVWRRFSERHRADPYAEEQYFRTREQVRRAVEVLRASDQLTSYGLAIVESISASVETATEMSAPATVTSSLVAHRMRWRLANTRPDPEEIRVAAQAYLSGAPAPKRLPVSTLVAGATPDSPAADGSRATGHGMDRAHLVDLLRAEPARAEPWVQYTISVLSEIGDSHPLVRRPEVFHALYREIASAGAGPHPVSLAAWLTSH